MDGDKILSQFHTFFTVDDNIERDMDQKTMWEMVIKRHPGLAEDDSAISATKEKIVNAISDKEFIKQFTEYFSCDTRDFVRLLIEMKYNAFDKYLIKKIICLLNG